jgi:hypothetical protein
MIWLQRIFAKGYDLSMGSSDCRSMPVFVHHISLPRFGEQTMRLQVLLLMVKRTERIQEREVSRTQAHSNHRSRSQRTSEISTGRKLQLVVPTMTSPDDADPLTLMATAFGRKRGINAERNCFIVKMQLHLTQTEFRSHNTIHFLHYLHSQGTSA